MAEKEIMEFVSKSIEQIKNGMPEGCGLNGNFDFEVAVSVTKGKKGNINLQLVEAGAKSNVQQVHRIRFSIVDKQSQKENLNQAMTTIRMFVNEIKQLEDKKRMR